MKEGLRLFVWRNVLTDYSSGIMFALAASPDHARELLLAGCSYLPPEDLAQEPEVFDTAVAFSLWGGG